MKAISRSSLRLDSCWPFPRLLCNSYDLLCCFFCALLLVVGKRKKEGADRRLVRSGAVHAPANQQARSLGASGLSLLMAQTLLRSTGCPFLLGVVVVGN